MLGLRIQCIPMDREIMPNGKLHNLTISLQLLFHTIWLKCTIFAELCDLLRFIGFGILKQAPIQVVTGSESA